MEFEVMKYDIDFEYEQGSDYGTGTFAIIKNNKYHYFDFEFSAIQEHDCSYSSHSSIQIEPDEDYYEYDVIDKITDLNILVQRIKKACNEDISEDEIDNLIRDEFCKKASKERYLYTREGYWKPSKHRLKALQTPHVNGGIF